MRVERDLMRGAGPVAVLKMLERGEMYGYELVQKLAQRSEGVLGMGQSTLYPMLYNLEAKGWVASRVVQAPGDRSRRYYRLTRKGIRQLDKQKAQWEALTKAMANLGITGA